MIGKFSIDPDAEAEALTDRMIILADRGIVKIALAVFLRDLEPGDCQEISSLIKLFASVDEGAGLGGGRPQ